MKKRISKIAIFLFLVISIFGNAQSSQDVFGTVSDRDGNKYNLIDVSSISSRPFGKPIGGGSSVSSITPSCQAGYFVLHYAPNSFLATSTIASTIQAVICQVFTDLSNFIQSPLSASSNTVKVHIYCDDAISSLGYAGYASPLYIYPSNPSNPYQGFLQNQIERAIQSGVDPFANISNVAITNGGYFYSGYLWINNIINWNYSTNTFTQSAGVIDMYTVVLHEALHALGFLSSINYDGFSKFGPNNNYYTYYDKFLRAHNMSPLLVSSTSSLCANSNITWNSSLTPSLILGVQCTSVTGTVDIPAPSNCGTNVFYASPSGTTAIYTPTCYQSGSSLSHFEDMCSLPSGYTNSCTPTPSSPGFNNLYYVMSNMTESGTCSIKRYPKPEERKVLCDLGYTVNDNYISSSGVAIANGTYSYGPYAGGICAPSQTIVGNHDGIIGGVYHFTTTGTSTVINIATDVLANDSPTTGLQMSCLEPVFPAVVSYTNNGTTITVTATAGSGLVVFKYLPKHTISGMFGPPTYIFFYFLETTCVPSTLCDHVENGGFENQISGTCGVLTFGGPVINCWRKYNNNPALFVNSCMTDTVYNLGVNTLSISPPVSSYNGTLNTHVIGIRYSFQSIDHESVQNNLAIPLAPTSINTMVPTQTYQVTFWAMNKAFSTGTPNINPNNSPCVINFASFPTYPILTTTLNQPSGLNSLINFTVPAGNIWTQYTGTFVVPTSSVNQNCLVVGYNSFQTASLVASSSGTYGQYIYTFIDDISIKPINSVTFSIPGANNCGNTNLTNLAQYASPVQGTFSGPGVTAVTVGTVTTYNFNSSGTGTYSIAFNYTYNSCSGTVWQNVIVHPPDFTISVNSSSLCLNTGAPAVAQASINSSNSFVFDWQPGYLAGATQTINSASTIYTISAQSANCIITQTFVVPTSSACCTNSISNYSSPVLTSPLSGNNVINSNIIVPSGTTGIMSGSILFAPNVKVTVQNGASLTIKDAHLYACSSQMWQGIEILDGGQVISNKELSSSIDNLIEDAINAINVLSQNTSTVSLILQARNTTFNKNYIDINISNITRTTTAYPFEINSCVFTCRDLPFNSTFWPQTGTVSAVNTASADLRYVNTSLTPTTGLTSPYLNQSTFSITTLKSPYTNQQSHIAINLNTVGITPGPAAVTNVASSMPGITIGNSAASAFNLFDAHGSFIVAKKSNVTLSNNVFQNTQTYTVSGGSTYGGTAVKHSAVYSATDVMHTMLNMYGSSSSTGNRFWNCHKGIDLDKTYLFWIENAIFRSTQSIANGTVFLQGNSGIFAATNNFDYYIANSEFTNIRQGINIPIMSGYVAPGPFLNAAPVMGIFAHRIRVSNNLFSAGTSTTNYMNEAVVMTSPNSTPWDIFNGQFIVPQNNTWPYIQGIIVGDNKIDSAFNGISINGSQGFQVHIFENNITLKDKSTAQYGIELKNCFSTYSTTVGKNDISNNLLRFSMTTAASNTLASLIFCGDNGIGVSSPSVSCNDLSQAGRGFVFDGVNKHALWGRNRMSTPMSQAFVLSSNGSIGKQGDSLTAMGNEWVGASTTWTGTNFGTWVPQYSNVLNSKLFVRPVSSYIPEHNGGFANPTNYNLNNGYEYMTLSNGGDYSCSQYPSYKVKPPFYDGHESDFDYYREKSALYRFLKNNDSIRDNDPDLLSFYNDLSGSSIDKFLQVEENIYYGFIDEAASVLAAIDDRSFNTLETNYKTFYTLYLRYLNLSVGERYHYDDSTSLRSLAKLCPGTNGPVIYQAIALFNSIYGELIVPDCSESGARLANNNSSGAMNPLKKIWELNVFPNPASTILNLISNIENESLTISILDLSGRIVYSGGVKTKDFIGKLDLDLINGAYLITIQNSQNEKITKKLLIAK